MGLDSFTDLKWLLLLYNKQQKLQWRGLIMKLEILTALSQNFWSTDTLSKEPGTKIPKHCPTGPLLREADLVIAVLYSIPHRHRDASMAASAWETVTVIALLGLLHKF